MKFSILAPGGIAEKMAEAVSGLKQIEKYAIASRTMDKAKNIC